MNSQFSQIIGHKTILTRLSILLERDVVPHALLFHGPKHLGKGSVAEALAKALLETDAISAHPNMRVITRARDAKTGKLKKKIGIEVIRELRTHLQMTGFLGKRKVVIIDEAERMSEEAANGLLKTLEEPSEGSVIILIVHNLTHILPTVRSRSALFPFVRVGDSELEDALRRTHVAEAEVQRFSRFSAGRPGIAVSLGQDPDMLHWYRDQESRWDALRRGTLHARFASLASLAPARADREETVRTITDATAFWETLLRRELRRGSRDAARLLEELAQLREGLDINIQPRLLLERFALAMEPDSQSLEK